MNLTPEQLELLFCLLGALAIGFLFGYFLARARARQRYDVEVEELSELLDTRDRELESSSAKYGQLKQHMAVQANEFKEINQKVLNGEALISQLGDEKTELQSLLMEKEKRISGLIDEVDFSKNELGSVQNLVNEYKDASSVHDEKLLTAQNEIEQNAKLNHSLIKKTEEQISKVKVLQDQKQSLDSKINMLTKSIDEKDNVISEYKKRTVEKEAIMQENQALKAKVENISKSLEETKAKVVETKIVDTSEIEKKYNNLEKSLENTRQELAQKDTNLANLQKSFEETNRQVEDANRQVAEKERDIISLQKDKSRLEEQTKTIQTQQNNNHESLQNEILNIKSELLRKDQKLKAVEEKLKFNQKDSSYLSGTEGSKDGTGFMKFVKDTFGSGDKNKNS